MNMKLMPLKDYELLDASDGERLERWGDVILVRPDPQIIWHQDRKDPRWNIPHARYLRSKTGGGTWKIYKTIPESWHINYRDIKLNLKLMSFKHTGVFPEQVSNWELFSNILRSHRGREINILNLFAYTGGATLTCLKEGASVCHVDSSKGMINMAKKNAKDSNLSEKPVRWIVDDCLKFIKRELKRGKKYDCIIMDPPTYGRGPSGELWRINDNLDELVSGCVDLLSSNPVFFAINSYTPGLSPSSIEYLLLKEMKGKFKGKSESYELGLKVKSTSFGVASGCCALFLMQ